MRILVLTGGIGSGKTTVIDLIKKNYPYVFCLSADELSRRITDGQGFRNFLLSFGIQNREELRKKIFVDNSIRKQVESYVHWRVAAMMLFGFLVAWFQGSLIFVVEIPIWFELPIWRLFKGSNLLVVAPMEDRIRRIMTRDRLTRTEVVHRIKAQMPDSEKTSRADHILHNTHGKGKLKREVHALMQMHTPSYFIHKVILYYGIILLPALFFLFWAFGH